MTCSACRGFWMPGANSLIVMNKNMKLVPSSMCMCNIGDQTTYHILQRCPNYATIRNQLSPVNTTLQKQIYGTLGNLGELIASFHNLVYQSHSTIWLISLIQQSGLSVSFHNQAYQSHFTIWLISLIS